MARTKRFLLVLALLGCLLSIGLSRPVSAEAPNDNGKYGAQAGCNYGKTFFGLPVWYKYLGNYERLDTTNACGFDLSQNKKNPNPDTTKVADAEAIVLIGLAIVEILLRVIGILAVAFVIVGGTRYILSQGEPDRIKQAQGTIINALIGLAIAIISSTIVAFVGKTLGG